MWICPQCHQQNQEDTVLCIKCSASRPTGRFNTASLQISSGIAAPRVSPAVAPAAEMRHAPDPYTRPSPAEPAPRPKAAEAPPGKGGYKGQGRDASQRRGRQRGRPGAQQCRC